MAGTALHCGFFLEVLDVAVDRCNREHLVAAAITHQAIAALDIAVDLELVPFLGMTDIIDRHVVMLAPEEWDIGKSIALSQDISRHGLTLALGHDPMFNPEIPARLWIRPQRNIAGGKNSRYAGLQVLVHDDAPVDLKAGALGELGPGPHADADDHEVSRQCRSTFQLDVSSVDRCRRLLEMEDDAMLFVQSANEVAEFAAEHAFHRPPVRCHDMYLQFAGPQGSGDLEPDKARAEHDGAPRLLCLGDDAPGIAERAQQMNMRLIRAGDIEANRFGAGCEEQFVER